MPPTFRPNGMRTKRERGREHDVRRREDQPWRAWYGLAVWQRIRAAQLQAEPLCRRCAALGEVTAATVVNHMEPHRGDWAKFIGGPFESVCKPHHDAEVQREERATTSAPTR